MAATLNEIVDRYLPDAAKDLEANGGYGWTGEYIGDLFVSLGFPGPAYAVRYFWYQRTVESAEYLDAGKPLTQIHRQAKEMLEYWDSILRADPTGNTMIPVDPNAAAEAKRPISFGEIERPWS